MAKFCVQFWSLFYEHSIDNWTNIMQNAIHPLIRSQHNHTDSCITAQSNVNEFYGFQDHRLFHRNHPRTLLQKAQFPVRLACTWRPCFFCSLCILNIQPRLIESAPQCLTADRKRSYLQAICVFKNSYQQYTLLLFRSLSYFTEGSWGVALMPYVNLV